MAEKNISGKIIQLVYTTEELSQEPLCNKILDNGLVVYEKCDNGHVKMKIGNGINTWAELEYIGKDSEINDESMSLETTYSSTKMNSLIEGLQSEVNDKADYDEIKEYIDSSDDSIVDKLTNGEIIVKQAEESNHAISADSSISSDSSLKSTQDSNGNIIIDTYETKTDASLKLQDAKTYADSVSTTAANTVKNDLLNGAGDAYDTLKELGDLIDDNVDAIEALKKIASSKADSDHTHTVENISDLTVSADELNNLDGIVSNVQSQLDNKVSNTITINEKQLTSDIVLSADDVNTYSKEEIDDLMDDKMNTVNPVGTGNLTMSGDVKATDSNGNEVSLLNTVKINNELSSENSTYSSDKIEDLLYEKMDANIVLEVNKGGTGYNTIADTTYSTARYRASSLHSSETTPATNGVIAWTYE